MRSCKKFWVLLLLLNLQLKLRMHMTDAGYYEKKQIITRTFLSDPCPKGFFRCPDDLQCLKERLQCDGIVHCSDYSDEKDCDDDMSDYYYWEKYYKNPHKPGKNVCFLSGNLPHTCECHGIDIFCDSKNLTSIPEGLPLVNIMLLDISNNYFDSINSTFLDVIPEIQMDMLVMKKCRIRMIDPGAFERITDLQISSLFLNLNYLKHVNVSWFTPGNILSALYLAGNQIRTIDRRAFVNLEYLEELDLRDNLIEVFEPNAFESLVNIRKIYLNDNRLTRLSSTVMSNSINLTDFSLIYNDIDYIEENSIPFPYIETLFLSGNRLTVLQDRAFCNLTDLEVLVLRDNELQRISSDAFACVDNLQKIDFMNNRLRDIDKRVFSNLKRLNSVTFSWFNLCQSVPHAERCSPDNDSISSKADLLMDPTLRVCVWVLISVTLTANAIVIIWTMTQKITRNSYAHCLYLRNMAVSGLLMGIYLVMLTIADIAFRGDYIFHGHDWRHGWLCWIAGFLNTLSYISATFLVTLTSWERFRSVKQPVPVFDLRRKTILLRLAVLWTAAILLAALPILPLNIFGYNFYGQNGACMPIYIDDSNAPGSEYALFLFVGINGAALFFIITWYIKTLIILIRSKNVVRTMSKNRERAMSIRFAIIVLVDCAIWILIISEILRDFLDFAILPLIFPWQSVFLYPLASALNPLIFAVCTIACRRYLQKQIKPANPAIRLAEYSLTRRGQVFTLDRSEEISCAETVN